MQARQLLAAALLAATAVGAFAQDLDRSETLQARSLAAQARQAAGASGRTRESVRAETRNLQAAGELQAVGERADAIALPVVPEATLASSRTRAEVKAELAQWRATHKQLVGDQG